MLNYCLLFEVMDKEPSLAKLYFVFGGLGILGLFLCRKIPPITFFVVPASLAVGWLSTQDLRDANVGPAVMNEAGLAYIILSYAAVACGVLMPLLGFFLARGHQHKDS
jgi:hypothetical protein